MREIRPGEWSAEDTLENAKKRVKPGDRALVVIWPQGQDGDIHFFDNLTKAECAWVAAVLMNRATEGT